MRFRLAAAIAASALALPFAAVSAGASGATPLTSSVRFAIIQYDSPGTDNGSNYSINKEWVQVHNYGASSRVLTNWTIRDNQNHVYKFPTLPCERTLLSPCTPALVPTPAPTCTGN